MQKRRCSWLLGLGLCTALTSAVAAGEPPAAPAGGAWRLAGETSLPAGQKLRGFGRCALTFQEFRSGERVLEKTRFRAETQDGARLLAGKFLNDLRQSYQVARKDLDVGGAARPAYVTAGGQALAVMLDGVTVSVLGAPDHATLAAYAASAPDEFSGAIAEAPFPGYMERYEWGAYGVSGVNDDFGWLSIDDGGKGPKDPRDDLRFLQEMGNLHFDNWVDQLGFDASDGMSTGKNWKTDFAEKHGIPYAHRFYVNPGGADWTARRFGEYMERPAWFLQNGWHGRGELFWKSQPHFSWFSKDIQAYLARHSQKMMEKANSPETRGWMHPHGELVHHNWYDMHGDYSPHAVSHWRNYLKKNGVGLEEASRMYRRGDAPFVSFDQVPVPEFATFAGLPGRVLSLAGDWLYRKEFDRAPQDDGWWERPAAERYPGLREKWYAADADMAAWRPIRMPGSDHVFEIYPDNQTDATAACWFRRHFVWDPASANGQRVWLYFFPISDASVHSGERARYHEFFLNGEKAGEIGVWGALDVTDRLRKGDNLLAFHLYGNVWDGRIFLSTDAPRVFPDLGPDQNRLYQLWNDWRVESKFEAWASILDAMRQVDPERPIKFMAPVMFGGEKWRQLCLRYGGWPHFTGEGFWFYPWYKRYAKLYGLPATSELGSPHPTLELQAEGFRRTFLAGLDGHEPVFVLQTYSRNPQVRKWWLDHRPVLQRMGKYDIYGPQVLLFRSSWNELNTPLNPYPPVPGQRSRQSLWDWDLGRGSLQAIGQSYLYLDDDGLRDGKMHGYPLIIDCGNETFAPETAQRLRAWVEDGGVFVALPFTGRHARAASETWPISALSGCKPTGERKLGGTVTFAAGQKIFADLAGRQFPDDGRCLDWLGNNSNAYSVELEPGDGCEVLATYENGRAAVVARRLGKGMVISFGSAFWRASQDRAGIWWPEESEERFLRSLLRAVNFPQPLGETNDRLIWAQPYRANNGLDAVSCLVNWHETGTQKPLVTLRLPRRPAKLVTYGVDGVKEIPFAWEDGVAKAEIEIASREVKVVAAEAFGVKSAVAHWWGRQQELWPEIVPSQQDFTAYDSGKWEDPTLDLAENVRFTNEAPQGDAWLKPGFKDDGWLPGRFAPFNFDGGKDGAPLWARRSFTLKPGWRDNGMIRLISGAWAGPHYLTPARLWLNGVMLHDFSQNQFNEYEVQPLLRPGENVVAMEFQKGEKFIGLCGSVFLNYRKPPARSLPLNGKWHGGDGKGGPATLEIPGAATVLHPARAFVVPAEWQGRYRVRFFAKGEPHSILGVWVNDRLVRRHHHHLGRCCDIDITDFLEFGKENRLELAHGSEYNRRALGEAFNFQLDDARIELFPVEP